MTSILAFSGKKQSGKNMSFNFLLGLEMLRSHLVRTTIKITQKGELYIGDMWGQDKFKGIFDINRQTEAVKTFNEENIYPYIKNYSFADCLKQDVLINLLGLEHRQCYGTDEDKQSFTHLNWEDMPGVTTVKPEDNQQITIVNGRLGYYYSVVNSEKNGFKSIGIYHEPGPMTAREVMQFVGTDIFRRMYGNIWANATINKILSENSELAVVTDLRFPNEVEAVQNAGGKVIRFTRHINDDSDEHDSEKALDPDRFDWSRFDAIIDNHEMTISQQNEAVHNQLVSWGVMQQVQMPTLQENE